MLDTKSLSTVALASHTWNTLSSDILKKRQPKLSEYFRIRARINKMRHTHTKKPNYIVLETPLKLRNNISQFKPCTSKQKFINLRI